MKIEPSKARILADCIESMAADAEDKEKDSFGIHLSLDDAHMITRALSTDPTVDAVPVVRCRECENWKPYGSKASRKLGDPLERYGGCEIWHGGHLESDFCSYGEREEEQNGRT